MVDVTLMPSVLWYCWLGLATCKNRRPYNLYCVGGDVKPCSINQSTTLIRSLNKGQNHSFWYKSISHIRLPIGSQ